MIKHAFSTFVSCVICILAANCQLPHDNDSLGFFGKLKKITIGSLLGSSDPLIKLRSITVMDYRSDTVRLGVFKNRANQNCQAVFDSLVNLQAVFTHYLAKDTASYNVVIVIKHLTLRNQTNLSRKEYAEDPSERHKGLFIFNARLYIEKEGSWLPLVKIDTSVSLKHYALAAPSQILPIMARLTSQAIQDALVEGKYERRKPLTISAIDSLNKTGGITAATGKSAVYGYYMNYSDFLANRVKPASFTVQKFVDSCYSVYEKQKDGSEVMVRHIWGLNDSTGKYIMNHDVVYKLYQFGNAWYWNGIFRYRQGRVLLPAGFPLAAGWNVVGMEQINTKMKYSYVPFLLNYETGDEYW